jgi:hypothetical protein
VADQASSPILPWIQVGITTIVAFVGPRLAVQLSLRQFRTQKWWERQQEAYTTLLESLSVILYYYQAHFDTYCRGEGWNPNAQVIEDVRQARYRLEQSSATGAYLVSDVAADALRKFHESVNMENFVPDQEFFRTFRDEAQKCIQVLKSEAKKDLKTAR